MPSDQVVPIDSDGRILGDDDKRRKHRSKEHSHHDNHNRSSTKDKDDTGAHRSRSLESKDRDVKSGHRSSSHRDGDDDRDDDRDDAGHRDKHKHYHRSSSSKYKDKDEDSDKSKGRGESYHRSSSRRERDGDDGRRSHSHRGHGHGHHGHSDGHGHRRDKHKDDMIVEDVDGDDEKSDIDLPHDRNVIRMQSRNRSSSDQVTPKLEVGIPEEPKNSGPEPARETDSSKIAQMMSPKQQSGRRGAISSDDHVEDKLDMFFKRVTKQDPLASFLPEPGDPILESVSEILFKPYPWQLKIFALFITISQFLTLVSLFYSLLPCPNKKPSWLVFIGVPLCCAYAGIECIHHMLRYVHLGKGYRLLVFLMNVNCVMQLLCVGVVMGKSEDMVNLIGNFVGVAIVLQIDEFLAVYIRIKDINPQLLESKSWRKKMMLNSKMWVIAIAAAFVYVVTIVCWRVDSLYCASYNLEGNLNHVNAGTVDPSGTVRFRF